ncbi:MAG: hypothetical protein ABI689_15575 [Thermoanaerobaculia bacterium]
MADSTMKELAGELLGRLAERSHEDGTTLARPDETESSVEATVWRALALRLAARRSPVDAASERAAHAAHAANMAIARLQAGDGRVSLSPLHPGAYTPTAIAVLAWHDRREFAAARERAVAFLLAQKGNHFPRSPMSPVTVDTELAGWSWIERTFSWAEPTALVLLALDAAGQGDHPRAREGRALLLDRQIASGGWNYGNSRVFGADLRPAPESTGLVLAALAGHVPATAIAASLAYFDDFAPKMRTPLALGWTLLAWSAWKGAPAGFAATAIRETLAREQRYGSYDSAELALLAVATQAPRGLLAALRETS